MSYTKQNFENGQVLTAEHLNNMEDGIKAVSEEIADLIVTDGTPDTLTFDGNTDGLASVDGVWFKVSDAVPTYADFVNGVSIVANGAKYDIAADAVSEEVFTTTDGLTAVAPLFVVVVPPEMAGVEDAELEMAFPEAGTYFVYNADALAVVTEFQLNGYTGFAKEKLNPELLPKAAAVADVTATPTADEFNNLLASLRAAGYLAN